MSSPRRCQVQKTQALSWQTATGRTWSRLVSINALISYEYCIGCKCRDLSSQHEASVPPFYMLAVSKTYVLREFPPYKVLSATS